MNRGILFAGFLFVLFCASFLNAQGEKATAVSKDQDWEWFTAEKGAFKVLAPGTLSSKIDTIETPIGHLVYHTYFLENDVQQFDNALYMVGYCDYPEGGAHSDSTEMLEAFFEESMSSAAFSIDGEVVYHDEIFYKGKYPGRFWRINYLNGQALVKTTAFLIKNRFYTIQTITISQKSLNSSSDKFIDSFTFLDPQRE